MKTLTRLVAVAACAIAAALTTLPTAQAASSTPVAQAASGCRYYYTSYFKGPGGETKGSGEYAEGDHDPEGRICRNGWWVSPYDLDDNFA
ncbi:hypothetical protein [Streptomyces sp. NPDC046939]|uniref:hypothetical protein n=1 Tax=Streptomyces sp. NPDC046939 TaxID=3155376 RepID=UPI0033D121EB